MTKMVFPGCTPGDKCPFFVLRPVRESHFSGLTRQVGRRMLDIWGGSTSPFSKGGSCSSFFTGGHVLQTMIRGGHGTYSVSALLLVFVFSARLAGQETERFAVATQTWTVGPTSASHAMIPSATRYVPVTARDHSFPVM